MARTVKVKASNVRPGDFLLSHDGEPAFSVTHVHTEHVSLVQIVGYRIARIGTIFQRVPTDRFVLRTDTVRVER